MSRRFVTALPVYNEAAHVESVLAEVRRYGDDILVIDDGSDDGTAEILKGLSGIEVIRHAENRGYGAALLTAFQYAARKAYEIIVTIDCDGQHEPMRIASFVEACAAADIVSGSRYLTSFAGDGAPPEDRRRINVQITAELNDRLGLNLTDAFCGFKAYRVDALERLQLTEVGYAMPLELWVQAAAAGLRVRELPVPLIYLEEQRSFGGALDESGTRLQYYRAVLQRSLAAVEKSTGKFAGGARCGEASA